MFFSSSSSSSSSSASPPAVVLFARILCVRIRLFLLPPLKHTLRAEEEEEEEEEYDVDAVFDDFATREARKVVCFVVIFASSHTTFRMPFALLFIHIVILFRFRADKNETFCLKAKESSLCALCLSLLGPKRRERVVRFCYKNERRKALLLLELSFYKAYNKEEQHERERDLCFFEETKGEKKQMNFSSSKKKSIKKGRKKKNFFISSKVVS